MGALNSHEFTAMDESSMTPSKPAGPPFRTIDSEFDPRSPSHNVMRTPIQLETTPPLDPMVDPRSPTVGIMRTPILLLEDAKGSRKPSVDSPLVTDTTPSIIRTLPKFSTTDSDEESLTSSPLLNRSVSEPDLSPLRLESLDDDEAVLLDTTVEAQLSMSLTTTKSTPTSQKPACILFPYKEEPAIATYTKPQAPRQLLKSSSEHQRSPLSTRNVDMNSPLAIVQRKQATRLGRLKSNNVPLKITNSPKYAVFEDDQENVKHTN